ncbi:MAG: ATP-binding cassette domain-containing protein [Deltaproteobacteria bacterium]|nr:ATP-binding cassette domain-containing protein [Deltaproteobacteria bacterium]
MIEVEGLTKYYGNLPALKDVTFRVQKGEILGFLGPNGAGKTTTMRILTCFIPASEGRVSVAGYDVWEDPVEVKKKIGYLPENVPLYTDIPVETYLLFVAEVKGVAKKERKGRIGEIMEHCGVTEVAHRYIGNLSKGYRQRVGIAQALVADPEVLVLDEPTLGLDPKQIVEIREMIKGLAGEKTVILSTHILPEVSMTCERVVIINEGRVVAEDRPENLTSQLQGSSKISLQVEGPKKKVISGLKGIPGVLKVEFKGGDAARVGSYLIESEKDIRRELAREVIDQGWGLLELRLMGISLEDVFVQLVTEEEK